MEQEETKTTAAAGVEMPPAAESWVQLHESELTELMQKQAKAAITELKRQEKQERKKEKYHNRNLLGGLYRENPVKSRNYEAVKSSKKWENVGNSYIIPALLLYRYSYI